MNSKRSIAAVLAVTALLGSAAWAASSVVAPVEAAETKAADTKAADTKAADTKPADTKGADDKSATEKKKFSKAEIEAFLSKCSQEADEKGLTKAKNKLAERKAYRRKCMSKFGIEPKSAD